MDEHRLGNFLAVVEHRHFTRAAEARSIAQSGLSTSIKSLERELGVTLFDRSTRRVELTAAGRAFVPEAVRVTQAIERARAAATAGAQGLRGRLDIGILYSLTPPAVLAAIARFAGDHAQVELNLRGPGADGSSTHVEDVAAGRLDLAVVMAVRPISGVHLHPVATDEVVLACGTDDVAETDEALTLEEVPAHTLIDFPRGWGVRNVVDRAFSELGVVNRNARVEINDLTTILDLVRHGLGNAFVPASMAAVHPDLRYLHVRGVRLGYRISIATGPHLQTNRVAVRLVDRLRSIR